MRSATLRILRAAACVGAVALLAPTAFTTRPASANAAVAPVFHLALTRSAPAKDSTVAPPASISLWFSEVPPLDKSTVKLTATAGEAGVKLGALTRAAAANSPVVATIADKLAAGVYRVDWTSVADDGDPAKGTFSFTVRAAQ